MDRIPKTKSTISPEKETGGNSAMKIYLPDEIKMRIQQMAQSQGKSQSQFIEDLVMTALARM